MQMLHIVLFQIVISTLKDMQMLHIILFQIDIIRQYYGVVDIFTQFTQTVCFQHLVPILSARDYHSN